MSARRVWACAVAILLLVGGCSLQPDAKEAQANLDKSRAAVATEVK